MEFYSYLQKYSVQLITFFFCKYRGWNQPATFPPLSPPPGTLESFRPVTPSAIVRYGPKKCLQLVPDKSAALRAIEV